MNNNNFKRPIANIDDATAEQITEVLNDLLANEYALFTKTLNYHWNVTGPRFHSLHKFLGEQYHELLEMMDGLAERVRVLGEVPHSTLKKMTKEMDINEVTGNSLSSSEMLSDLFNSHMMIQSYIKTSITTDKNFEKQPGIEDFLVGLLNKHEMMSWMLKSHLD